MAIEWVFEYRPSSFDEMALYPLLRKRLEFYAHTGEFLLVILGLEKLPRRGYWVVMQTLPPNTIVLKTTAKGI